MAKRTLDYAAFKLWVAAEAAACPARKVNYTFNEHCPVARYLKSTGLNAVSVFPSYGRGFNPATGEVEHYEWDQDRLFDTYLRLEFALTSATSYKDLVRRLQTVPDTMDQT